MIELINFSKSYPKSSFSIENLSMNVKNGSITGLLGVNGSGKTTILKAICGFHFPSGGTITIDGVNTEDFPEKTMELIGYVPEISQLPVNMVVSDFLAYAGETHGIQGDDLDKAIGLVTKECSLENLLNKKIKTLSKGQQQRVSFAQAIIHNPPNLVLDEPVSGLDPAQIIQMRDLIKKLSKTKAVLMSTHILQEVYSLCSTIYVMNNGKIVGQGSEEDIVKSTGADNLEQAFLKLSVNY